MEQGRSCSIRGNFSKQLNKIRRHVGSPALYPLDRTKQNSRENELDRCNKQTILIFRDLKDSWKVEVGAMRLPHHHRFTHHLIQKFGLKTSLFYNKHADDYFYFRGLKVKECWMHVYPAFGMSCVTFLKLLSSSSKAQWMLM